MDWLMRKYAGEVNGRFFLTVMDGSDKAACGQAPIEEKSTVSLAWSRALRWNHPYRLSTPADCTSAHPASPT